MFSIRILKHACIEIHVDNILGVNADDNNNYDDVHYNYDDIMMVVMMMMVVLMMSLKIK